MRRLKTEILSEECVVRRSRRCANVHLRVALQLKHSYCASAGSRDTTPAEPHPNSNTQQTKSEISQCGGSTT